MSKVARDRISDPGEPRRAETEADAERLQADNEERAKIPTILPRSAEPDEDAL